MLILLHCYIIILLYYFYIRTIGRSRLRSTPQRNRPTGGADQGAGGEAEQEGLAPLPAEGGAAVEGLGQRQGGGGGGQ